MARTALPGRLTWQVGTAVEFVAETPRARSIRLDLPQWSGHRPGQHVDVRLTADDGYQAQRSYSIASAPEDDQLVLTVERLDDGEVSPYLVDEMRTGEGLELRGRSAATSSGTSRWAARSCGSPADPVSHRSGRCGVTIEQSGARSPCGCSARRAPCHSFFTETS
jgi:Oxidoreductase FAD-binding domain